MAVLIFVKAKKNIGTVRFLKICQGLAEILQVFFKILHDPGIFRKIFQGSNFEFSKSVTFDINLF